MSESSYAAGRDEVLAAAMTAERQGRWSEAMSLRASVARAPIMITSIRECPWQRFDWHGHLVSLYGCASHDFTVDDVAAVIGYGESGDADTGEAAGIALLKDGRYVAWESNFDLTGSGFNRDAYGGDADIAFATTPGPALEYLSERSREMIRWP